MVKRAADPPTELPRLLKLVLWLGVLGTIALAIHQTQPPPVVGRSAPATEFSAARAQGHLPQIAREPHPIGTAANEQVRGYLVQQLQALGAEVRVEAAVGVTHSGRQISAGLAHNIVATLPGTANRRAVMLATHYDSVSQGPGAADAGSGVVAILEVIRALKAGPPLQNDVLVLLSDGEEEGLIGAAAFVREHPEIAQRAGVVMNFEARGSSGPAMMFETSEGNGWVTREFARAAPHPFASSLAYAVYQRLPNDTDMTVFKEAGLTGLNFAFSGTFENYHTRRDLPETLDPRSLQHVGANALALTRHFGELDEAPRRAADRVYFNWFGSRLIAYDPWMVWLLLVLTVLLCTAVLVLGHSRKLITAKKVAAAFGGALLLILAVQVGAYGAWRIASASATGGLLFGDAGSNALIVLGCLAVGAAFGLVLQNRLLANLGPHHVAAGELLLFAALAVPVSIWFPAGSYLLQWPLLFALGGLLVLISTTRRGVAAFCAFCTALPAILLFAPVMALLFVILGAEAIPIAVLAFLLALFIVATVPLLAQIRGRSLWTAALLIGFAVISIGLGLRLSRFSAEHPRRNTIVYSLNADQGKAAWVSYDRSLDSWTREFVGDAATRAVSPAFTVGSMREVFAGETDVIPLAPPVATLIGASAEGSQRRLRLHLVSPRGASAFLLRFPAATKLLSLTCNGRSQEIGDVGADASSWFLRYNAVPPTGVDLELLIASPEPLRCWVADRSLGLPEVDGQRRKPRPDDMMAWTGSDVTIVAREYTF